MNADAVKEYIQALIEGLTPLAQKLGIAVEYLFTWAVKHNYAIAGSWVFAFLITCFLGYLVIRAWKWGMRTDGDSSTTNFDKSEFEPYGVITIIATFLVTIFFFITTIGVITTAVPRIIAPEYYTIQDIVDLIRKNPGQ